MILLASEPTLQIVELVLEDVNSPVWDLLWVKQSSNSEFGLKLDQLYDLVSDLIEAFTTIRISLV
ncbi:hypothetical protein [Pantoea eucrina]|uniref:hypothetical protein n=1 Tax=Pantoea eucrina TaxID=472693 RepID=UPI00080F568A|nr:hypothetical protein [Pantoea eucrina]